jgi:hypothetical protein
MLNVWVRLERELSDSWLEAHIEVPAIFEPQLFDRLDIMAATMFPGWEVLTYCHPDDQGADGRPDDLQPGEQY